MKKNYTTLLFLVCIFAYAQEVRKTSKPQIVEIACGQCKFGMPGKSCDLAVRIKGKCCFVDGTAIDAHGDAHAKDGFCNAIRKAKVKGKIINDRFKVEYLELLPLQE